LPLVRVPHNSFRAKSRGKRIAKRFTLASRLASMQDPLRSYLHDHLAGARMAVELLQAMEEKHRGHETGQFAAQMLKEIQPDKETLEQIIKRVGNQSIDLMEAVGWLGEKASRLKLNHGGPAGAGVFEAIELLSLGVLGKLAMWRALDVIASEDERLTGVDYEQLAQRARDQHAKVEQFRLHLAVLAFKRVAA
jgi:hypothetical protein